MIALGGVIGAGLFVGSGVVINPTGPAAVISYLLAQLRMRRRLEREAPERLTLKMWGHPSVDRRHRGRGGLAAVRP